MTAQLRAERWVTRASWAVVVLALTWDLALTGPTNDPDRTAVLVSCVSYFGLLIARLAVAMRRAVHRSPRLPLLAIGILLWAAESAWLQATRPTTTVEHLADGEPAFLAAYLAFALYVLLSADSRPQHALRTWLETVVICGGSASVAAALMLSPMVDRSRPGLVMLVALIYPVFDLVLALLIVAQVGLRMRRRDLRSARLCGGFLILGIADATFVGGVLHGSQDSSVATVVLWAAGFALVVSGASRPVVPTGERPIAELPATILAGAAVAATVVQLIRPYGELGLWLAAPAVVTIVSAVFRLILALRDARYAAEAIVLSQTDDLTALPNRRAVLARVDADLEAGRPLALMIMDLDGFKDVNDALGHALGDLILRDVAGRMRSAMPEDVMVARLGGDEFAVVVPDSDELRLLTLANEAADAVRQPTLAVDMELVVGASVGVAVREAEDRDSSGLMRRADIAMYQAKVRGGGALLYDRRSDDSRQRLEMAEELRRALPDGQLVLYYQPQIDARSRRVCGVEGLVRWVHPTRGVLAPAAFLPTARHAALMPALSDAVLRRAVQDMSAWRGAGLDVERIALNFSPPELLGGVFASRFGDAIAAAQLDPRTFVIEVTEDTFFSDPERALEVLHQLRECGTQVSIDDYGTGFSSLSYLRDVPVDELKMDRSFITGMVTDPRTRMIVESTVRLAEALDLRMVAEGVEDAATLALVSMTGADVVQGYYVARPMPAAEVPRWYASWMRGVAEVLAIEAR